MSTAAEELAKKKNTRAGHRGSATKMLTKLDGLLSASRLNVVSIAQMRPRVQEKLDQLKRLDEEIIALLSDETELVEEIEHSDETRAPLLAALVNIDMQCSPDTSATVPSPITTTGGRPPAVALPSHNVKLPKLTIRPFNGDLTSWTSFWDSYRSAIHDNPGLSEIDKFNYL